MKKVLMIFTMASLTACAASKDQPKQPIVGMANPASVYCKKVGGQLNIVNEPSAQVGYCTLPGGERIEEWALYRRDNK